MSLSLLMRQDRLLALRNRIDANGGGAVHLYALPEVPTPETSATAPPLAIITLAVPCAVVGSTTDDLATLTLTARIGFAAVSGQIGWARFVDGAGTAVYDAPAGVPGSGKPVIVTDGKPAPSNIVYSGGEVQIASALWTE